MTEQRWERASRMTMWCITFLVLIGVGWPLALAEDETGLEVSAKRATTTTVRISATSTLPGLSSTKPNQPVTDGTLPLTGIEGDQAVLVALMALAAGSGLVSISPKGTRDTDTK